MKQVAAEAGVSVMTVSYALRDHPEVSRATRERVKAVAERMGFRPDPMLSALVAYRSELTNPASHGALGMVTPSTISHLQHTAFGRLVIAAARKRAQQLGYTLEMFPLDPALSSARSTEILRSRGIDGLLVAPPASPDTRLALGWEHFSAVSIGRSLASPKLDFVSANQYAAALQVHDELRERGYARIGFVACGGIDSRVQHRFMAGYAAREFELHGRLPLPPLLENTEQKTPLATWLKRYKPDAIISDGIPILSCLEQLGFRVPEEIGVALCVIDDTPHRCSGIRVGFDQIGARAVDFLHMKMLHDEKGVPRNPTGWVISGTWQEGETLRSGR